MRARRSRRGFAASATKPSSLAPTVGFLPDSDSTRRRFNSLSDDDVAAMRALLEEDAFFWLDLERHRDTLPRLGEALGIPEHALLALQPGKAGGRFHADGEHVVFPFYCIRKPDAPLLNRSNGIEPLEVYMLVHGKYMLTLHPGHLDLQEMVGETLTAGRSEQYWVYSALEAMSQTLFEALSTVELAIEQLEDDLAEEKPGQVRRHRDVIRAARGRLTSLRRRLGPQRALFERVAEEITEVRGLTSKGHEYLERIDNQLERLVDGIDAAGQSIQSLLDLRLNETMYRLTVVATIFLPLSFVTGFFGMNFDWMVQRLDTFATFLILGLGTLVLSGIGAAILIRTDGRIPGLERLRRGRG